MSGRKLKKTTTVHTHPMRIPPSKKRPLGGTTIRHQHARRVYTSYDIDELKKIYRNYNTKKLTLPTSDDLGYPNGNKYDELIAIWVDYFNKIFPPKPPHAAVDPDLVKALIGSESDFNANPKNPKAFGITQITPSTHKIINDPNGEMKDYLFKNIRQKDLLDPEIAIPCGVRWFFYKNEYAKKILKRSPTPEEAILFYKGLQKSSTSYKKKALEKFQKLYAKLKK